ncbi:MAG TPA: molybdopterin molybdotransferase MoeA [Streptosporangiaceae bacterium]|nr:molybdopterin molybdotransferase MoeA [Streptosporangiaceae bacterium]
MSGRAQADGPRLGPEAAYAVWLAACAAAGCRGGPAGEHVRVEYGLGRVTAVPVRARRPAPRFECAAMDGIAVRAGPAATDASPAHRWRLAASAFTWVDTGDPMPAGANAVIERERVELRQDGSAWVTGPAAPGRNVRAKGEDFRVGELLVPAGHRLRPADLAAVASAGRAMIEIARRPVVAIVPTGDEIRPVGKPLGPGQVTDSNSVMLAARVTEVGATPRVYDVQPDDPAVISAQVRDAALASDLVLVLAGSSAGRDDHTAAALADVGGLAVRGVAVRPGHPVLLGHVTRTGQARAGAAAAQDGRPAAAVPAIGVPGYPLAAAVIFELFAMPLLMALQGAAAVSRPSQSARLGCDWTSSPELEDWVPVSLSAPGPAGGAVVATPGGHGAGAVTRLVRAHAWWQIPIGQGTFTRGESIQVLPISAQPPPSLPGPVRRD